MTTPRTPEHDALTAAVVVEHQVVYGYGVAGARLPARERATARAALDVHRLRRDQLSGLLTQQGVAAPVAAAAYALPFPVTDPASARRLCAALEDGCTGAAWDLAAATPAQRTAREIAVTWLTDAATRAAAWRGPAGVNPSLPGQPA